MPADRAEYLRQYYVKNRERLAAKQRENRARNKIAVRKSYRKHREKRLKQKAEWKKNNPDKVHAMEKAARMRYPMKTKARDAFKIAVRYGKIKRPKTCSNCGTEGKVEGHHPDYTKPLEVVWLCKCCHMEAHAGRPGSQ